MESFDGPQIYPVVRQTWLSRKPSVDAQLMASLALLVVSLVSLLYWRFPGLEELLPATKTLVYQKSELWRLWTTSLVHADLGHLLSNSLLLFILGYFLAGYFGASVFPFTAFLMGGVTNAISLITYAPDTRLIGASGIVSWMGGAWLMLYFLINTQVSVGGRALRALGVGLMLFAPVEAFDPKVSYRTHMIGLFLGLVWAWFYYRFREREFKQAEVREIVVDI